MPAAWPGEFVPCRPLKLLEPMLPEERFIPLMLLMLLDRELP
jgi:hypothetical protein